MWCDWATIDALVDETQCLSLFAFDFLWCGPCHWHKYNWDQYVKFHFELWQNEINAKQSTIKKHSKRASETSNGEEKSIYICYSPDEKSFKFRRWKMICFRFAFPTNWLFDSMRSAGISLPLSLCVDDRMASFWWINDSWNCGKSFHSRFLTLR